MKSRLQQILDSIDITNFIEYFKTHNIAETADYYKISKDRVTQICKTVGFKKDQATINNQIRKTKEANFDSLEDLNRSNTQKSNKTLIEKYGSLEKAKESIIKKRKETVSRKSSSFTYKVQAIDKDEFIDLYINQNKPREYLQEKYNLSSYMIDKVINYFKCNKPKDLAQLIGKNSKYTKYGGKDNYYSHLSNKIKESKILHYGSWENAKLATSESCKNAWDNKTEEELLDIRNRTIQTNMQKYGVQYSYQLPQCRMKGNDSKPNRDFDNLLISLDIKHTREYALENRSYDFRVDNILIEIDPSIIHNSTWSPFGDHSGKPINYHMDKSKLAERYGYRCIHVWDWDDKKMIAKSLLPRESIHARKCIIKEIDKYHLDEFLTSYHFQGSCKNQAVKLGLYYEDRLLQVMTFGKPRYNRNYEWELLRLCTLPGYMVVGGAEKLFKYFVNKYSPSSIISYCDLSKFTGDVYTKLGMKLISTSRPTRHWYHPKLHEHVTDNFLRQRGFDQLYGKLFGMYGKGTSNEELMLEHGFVEIYDCGQASYGWKKLT